MPEQVTSPRLMYTKRHKFKTDASFTSEKCLHTLSRRLAKLSVPSGAKRPEQRGTEREIVRVVVLQVVRAVVRTVVRAIVSVVVVVVEQPRARQSTEQRPTGSAAMQPLCFLGVK